MKKYLFILISVIFVCCSCDVTPTKRDNAYVGSTKYNEYIELNDCCYYKVKIGEHDVYQYTFKAYWGIGSDIIHFEDMCEYCQNKNK